MTAALRVAVIGAGIVGAAAALHLAEHGAAVVLVDDDRPGRATYAGAGIVAAPWRHPGTAGFALTFAAVAAYPDLVDRLGAGGCFEVIGGLYVAPEGPALDATVAGLAAAEAGGHLPRGSTTRLGPGEAARAFPPLRADLAGVHLPATARVHGDTLRTALVVAAARGGVQVRSATASLAVGGAGIEGVIVDGARLGADAVLVSAGAWSADLVRPTGFELLVAPQRGQIIHLGLPGDDTSPWPVVQPIGADHYLLPFPDHRIVVGATRETGSGFAPLLTAGGVHHVLTNALDVAPGLAGATVVDLRVGLRPVSADGDPLLGPVPTCPGLWVATGMGPQGLTVGPYAAQLVADAILGRPLAVDLGPFAPARCAG